MLVRVTEGIEMEIIYKKTEELKEYENNPRNNEEAVDYVANSIKEFGFKNPIILSKDNVIIAGHTRLKAAKKLGIKEVPCIMADDLTDEQVKAFRLADNKVGEIAEWDLELLDLELIDIDMDMTEFGFEFDEEEKETEVTEDDYEVEPPEEPKAQYGDIYQLGRHRLMCGDSTKREDVERLMNGSKADMVFTDPPYGMKKENEGVMNDNLNFNDLLEFNKEWISLTFDSLKDNGSWYCWGIDEPLMDIYSNILKPMAKENKITFRNLITWDKGNGQGQLSEEFRMYPIADEKCLFVMRGVQGFNNNADNYFNGWDDILHYLDGERNKMNWTIKDTKKIAGHSEKSGCHWFDKSQWCMPTEEVYNSWKKEAKGLAFKKEYEEIKKEYEEIKKEWYSTRAYFNNTHDNMNNVWHFDRAGKDERVGHATPKPIALCARAIKTSSRENEIVLDVFGGSGSTLIACEQLDRTCFMMELEPQWIDVIIDRWEKFTGEKAVKL